MPYNISTDPNRLYLVYTEADMRQLGMVEVGKPSESNASWTAMWRYKAHRIFRMEDQLWHYFRYADPVVAQVADFHQRLQANLPMMPK